MRYQRIGILTCLVVLILVAGISLFDKEQTHRYHQHLEEPPAAQETGDYEGSHLPLLLLNTDGAEIPGVPLSTEEDTEFTTTADGDTTLRISLSLIGHEDRANRPDDDPTFTSQAEIRLRGNSSRYYDKPSYLLRLIDEEGTERRAPLLGMAAHNEWALYGPYLDKTLIRNYMWYNVAGEIMEYAPNVRYCELYLNGEYRGLYLLVETITSGENCRLNLSKPVDGTNQTGYALRLDRGSSNSVKNIDTFTQYALRNLQKVDIQYPGAKNLTPELTRAIEQDFSDFEKSLYSYDYDTDDYGFWNTADTQSFIDYFIINEFTCNYDAGWLSTYIYKDIGGKYKLCIWDFNSACDNYAHSTIQPHHFELQYNIWYFMMTKDDRFCQAVIDRYRELRHTYLSEEYLLSYVDDTVAWLGDAVDRNFEVWGYTMNLDLIQPAERNPRSFEGAVVQLKNYIIDRGRWMDEHIDILLQYGHESKVKKFNH